MSMPTPRPGPFATPVPAGYVPPSGPHNATHRPMLRRWLATGAFVLLFLAGGAIMAGVMGLELGLQVALQAMLVALIPLAVVVPAFLWLDRHEAEPTSSLVVAFFWGALVATAISLLINSTAAQILAELGFDPQVAAAVAVAPVVEETTKGLGILVILVMRRSEFDGVLDGVVYAGIIAAGFAFGENILYLGQSVLEGGTPALALTFVLRGLMSPFAHPLFTMWTGVGIGMLVTGRTALRALAPFAGLLLAMALHAMWNAGSTFGFAGWVGSYLLVQVPIFVAAILFALWIHRREDAITTAHLQHYARLGVLNEADLAMLSAAPRRKAALTWAARAGGRPMKRAMRDFQDDAIELAYLRARQVRGRGGPGVTMEERHLVESTLRAKAAFTVR